MLALILVSVGSQVLVMRHLDVAATVREQLASSPRARNMTEEQMDRTVQAAERFAPYQKAVGAVAAPLVLLLIGGVYFLGLKAVGSDAEFKPVFSTTLHAMLPPAVVSAAVMVLIVSQRAMVTGQELARLVKSNLAAFLSPDASKPLVALAGVLDVFNVWTWVLLALGLAIVGRVSRGKAVGVVAGVWGLWILAKVAMAAMF